MNIDKFNKSGTITRIITLNEETCKPQLPKGIYILNVDNQGQFFLNDFANDFTIEGELYGDILSRKNKMINTFKDRKKNTGILLTGEKGSGKSLLSKLIANDLLEEGIPVILINSNYTGDSFNEFISKLGKCLLFFDEFEKVYEEREEQEALLSLLDGSIEKKDDKKLILFTANDPWKVNNHFINRPGRIFYHIEYTGLTKDAIIAYCEKNLENKTLIPQIMKLSSLFLHFNFDMLKALVEELNRYGCTLEEALQDMNVRPERPEKNGKDYIIVLESLEGLTFTCNRKILKNRNPYLDDMEVYISYLDSEESNTKENRITKSISRKERRKLKSNDWETDYIYFSALDLKVAEEGKLIYEVHDEDTDKNWRITLQPMDENPRRAIM